MVKLHLLPNVFQIRFTKQCSSSGVMRGEGSHIEDVVIENKERFFCLLRVLSHLIVVFEFYVD